MADERTVHSSAPLGSCELRLTAVVLFGIETYLLPPGLLFALYLRKRGCSSREALVFSAGANWLVLELSMLVLLVMKASGLPPS